MGAIEEIKAVNPELAEDREVQSLAEEVDFHEDVALFANSPAGKRMAEKLRAGVLQDLSSLFAAAETPELGTLISAIRKLEADLKILRQFTNSSKQADADLETLHALLSAKR